MAAGVAYAGATLAHALLRPLIGDRDGWLELVDDLEPWAYLPAPVIGGLGAAMGSGALGTAGAALAATFALRWGHRFLRRAPAPPDARADLKIMTFNTLAWHRQGRDLAASIVQAEPDLVGLQEIGPSAAEYLAMTLADRFPYHYATRSATSSGAAILSRYPLRDEVAFRVSDNGHWWQRAIVDAPFGPITYLNIHTRIPIVRNAPTRLGPIRIPLAFQVERRRGEIRRLVDMLQRVDGPAIVGGDFNMTEWSQDHRLMAGRLHDAYRAAGTGLGLTFPSWGSFPSIFPAPWPMLRLDYVWHSEHFAPAWAYRGDAGESDHHPIVVGLRWVSAAGESGGTIPLAASTV